MKMLAIELRKEKRTGVIPVLLSSVLLPQATSERLIIRASISAVNFFMVDSSFFNFFPSCIMFDR